MSSSVTGSSMANNQIRGHKAAINNPKVSEDAKERSRQAMEELSQTDEAKYISEGLQEQKDPVRQNAGYKATLSNPQVSEEAKQHAREILEERDAL
ncbi:Conidiation protein 6-domain-containing protein [Dichomitus squalens]|uniref:Conidiation protein 6-domain-containing protein n=1 Tax=Dichomitus squalens TaxID=114155 RepID=A0A4Q9MTX9_9APHY|nr:Conidiation protein 6-domain-containing protein [Dichomitus squalens]